jgi:hypothetical protein
VVISIAVFLAGIIRYRVGFASSRQGFQFNILSPVSLYDNFKALIAELSGYRDVLLIVICLALLIFTAASCVLWLNSRRDDATTHRTRVKRYAGPLANLRSISILGIATLTVFAALAYRQYVWHFSLPINGGGAESRLPTPRRKVTLTIF